MKKKSNKKIGNEFENDVVEIFAKHGYWARKMFPDADGSQPFDVLAVLMDRIYAVDCKTCCRPYFPLSRVEDNQWIALHMFWMKTNNSTVGILARYAGKIYFIDYELASELWSRGEKGVKLDESLRWEYDFD